MDQKKLKELYIYMFHLIVHIYNVNKISKYNEISMNEMEKKEEEEPKKGLVYVNIFYQLITQNNES